MNIGWFRISRKLFDNEIWYLEPFTKGQAWVDLIGNANHKDGQFEVRGNFITIKRGQIGWSEVTMAKRWKWSRNKVRRYLKWLETIQQIEQQKDRYLTTIITIINYDKYQNDTADDTAERQQTIQQTIHKQERIKNDKEITNTSGVKETELAVKYLFKWNEVFGTQYSSTRQIVKPLSEWVKDHPIDKILSAIENIKNDPYWKGKNLDPIWLLRFKDPKGEPIDRIEKFFNTKPVVKWQTHL